MRVATQTAINAAVQTGWTNDLPALVFSNHQTAAVPGAAWARASLIFGDDAAASIGDLLTRTIVLLTVQVFMPPNTGTRPAMLVADALKGIFPIGRCLRYENGGNDVFAKVQTGPNGPMPAGMRDSWEQQNLTVTFRVDETNAES